jgi:hypothetical protein
MGTKSRDRLYGTSVRIAAQRAVEARQEADKLACEAWTKRMLAFKGRAQPSPIRLARSSMKHSMTSDGLMHARCLPHSEAGERLPAV